MKEAVGGISLFQIVMFFIVLFTGYVCLSINYSKAYGIKNELLTIIKNQGGVCTADSGNCYNFKDIVTSYLLDVGYRSTGKCNRGGDSDWVGYDRNGNLLTSGDKAAFCIKGVQDGTNSQLSQAVYYKVKVFYQLDLPIINSIFNFTVSGETSKVYSPNECDDNPQSYCWCNNSCQDAG